MNNLVVVQKKEDRISKRKKKGKGQIMLAVEYPDGYRNRFILSTNRFIQTERYFCRGTTPVDNMYMQGGKAGRKVRERKDVRP